MSKDWVQIKSQEGYINLLNLGSMDFIRRDNNGMHQIAFHCGETILTDNYDLEEERDKAYDLLIKMLNPVKSKRTSSVFVIPTAKEVEEYAAKISFTIKSGDAFIDYYGARDWTMGNTKIKCWRACLRTWKSRREAEKAETNNIDEWKDVR